jgi:hypothetical protein
VLSIYIRGIGADADTETEAAVLALVLYVVWTSDWKHYRTLGSSVPHRYNARSDLASHSKTSR